MAAFLGLNTGAEDSMLIDAGKSYFSQQSWVPSSNFVREIKDIEPTNTPNFGTTIYFTIDKAADLLGNLDLELDIAVKPSSDKDLYRYLVDGFGYAMIKSIKFTIGANIIQEHDGTYMYLQNALTKPDEKHLNDFVLLDHDALTKSETGREYIGSMQVLAAHSLGATIAAEGAGITVDSTVVGGSGTHLSRSLRPGDRVYYGGLFLGEVFVANADNFTLDRAVTFGQAVLTDQRYEVYSQASPRFPGSSNITASQSTYGEIKRVAKRVIHGDTNEIPVKMQKIILPLGLYFSQSTHRFLPLMAVGGQQVIKVAIELHNFDQLCFGWDTTASSSAFITNSSSARKVNSTDVTVNKCVLKAQYYHLMGNEAASLVANPFSYIMNLPMHQGPEIFPMSSLNELNATQKVIQLSMLHPIKEIFILIRLQKDLQGGDEYQERGRNYYAFQGNPDRPANMDDPTRQKLLMESVELEINGNKTHPVAIERDYLVKRLMAQSHTCGFKDGFVKDGGTEEIYALHFGLSPEALNPSGHLNFTKASNPKLLLNLKKGPSAGMTELDATDNVFVDIYATYYNWITATDGRWNLAFH